MSIPRSPDWLLALLLAILVQPAGAAPDPAAAQRERIAQARLAVERDARAAQAACTQRFAVTDCINQVKAERRARLQPLDRERAMLDDDLRKRRAAERLAEIQRRQAARIDARPEVSVRSRKPAASEPAASAAEPRHSPEQVVAAHRAAASQAGSAAAQRAAAAARRNEQAQAHRLAVEKRNQVRAQQREPAKPLPLPAAPAASQ